MTSPTEGGEPIANCPECDAPVGAGMGCAHWPAVRLDPRSEFAKRFPVDGGWSGEDVTHLVGRLLAHLAQRAR